MNNEFNQISGTNRTLNLQVARQIAIKILSGDLPESSIIPGEMKLCDQLGVSRTALREAIKLLSSKGLLDSRPKVGTRVCLRTNWNFLDPQLLGWLSETEASTEVYEQFEEIRHAVEPEAAFMAAKRASKQDIDNITFAFEDLARIEGAFGTNEWDRNEWISACVSFHKSIFNATGNCFYAPFSNLIMAMFHWYEGYTNPKQGPGAPEYKALYDAIIEKSPEKAKQACIKLLSATAQKTESAAMHKPAVRAV